MCCERKRGNNRMKMRFRIYLTHTVMCVLRTVMAFVSVLLMLFLALIRGIHENCPSSVCSIFVCCEHFFETRCMFLCYRELFSLLFLVCSYIFFLFGNNILGVACVSYMGFDCFAPITFDMSWWCCSSLNDRSLLHLFLLSIYFLLSYNIILCFCWDFNAALEKLIELFFKLFLS